jgi:hypothetical protein
MAHAERVYMLYVLVSQEGSDVAPQASLAGSRRRHQHAGSFDTIDHDWLVQLLAERMDNGALRRLIRKWLKAGVLDTDGTVLHPVTGTPQGGPVTPQTQ